MKKLTRRQKEFLGKFLDLYRQEQGALHYTAVARHLGVGDVSAYEMLRLLEERGLVTASYQLPPEPRGPGRAVVLFRPTPPASQLLHQLSGGEAGPEEWEATKERMLRQLEAGKLKGYEALLKKLLAQLPDESSPLVYGAEMITTIVLALESIRNRAGASTLLGRLKLLVEPTGAGLNALAGLSMGLPLIECIDRQLANCMLAQSARFQQILSQLGVENCRRLAEFSQEALRIING